MITGNEGLSVADALALRSNGNNNNGDSMFGGNGAWWVILLVLLFGAGGLGRGGWGNNNGGSYGIPASGYTACCTPATAQGVTDAFNFNQLDNGIRGLERGMCDGFYTTSMAINNVLSALQNCCCQTQLELSQGFGGVNQSIANLGYNMSQGFCGVDKTIMQSNFQNQAGFNALATQLAQCCCDMRYNMASQACDTRNLIQTTTRDIIDNQNANSRAILDFLTQDKIDALRTENQALKFQVSQTAQNAYIAANQEAQTAELIRRLGADCPVPAYIVPNPNCCYSNSAFNFNSGCGCC